MAIAAQPPSPLASKPGMGDSSAAQLLEGNAVGCDRGADGIYRFNLGKALGLGSAVKSFAKGAGKLSPTWPRALASGSQPPQSRERRN